MISTDCEELTATKLWFKLCIAERCPAGLGKTQVLWTWQHLIPWLWVEPLLPVPPLTCFRYCHVLLLVDATSEGHTAALRMLIDVRRSNQQYKNLPGM